MAAITIDSPRWLEGWGEPQRDRWAEPLSQPRQAPVLRLVAGAGSRRTDLAVYRRRRLVALVVVGLVLAAALAVGSMLLTRVGSAGSVPQGRQVHVVAEGETYWSIAADHAHGADLRVAVDELVDVNGARLLLAGDRIELP